MGWDFATEPDLEGHLAWVRGFAKEEVAPLDPVFPHMDGRVGRKGDDGDDRWSMS
ncbi:MAG TPA: hypothetical protein VLX59_17310 [Acidimicrobiales bacterium]|nr:hypothetical protein [Acidimicrobiales bacterium]